MATEDYLTPKQSTETETLYRKARGARIECERLELQLSASLKRAQAIVAAMLLATACVATGGGSDVSGIDQALDAGHQLAPSIPDASAGCVVTLCGVPHPELCRTQYGDVVYYADPTQAPGGVPSWCSTSDEGVRWRTCCAVYCTAGDATTFEYHCGVAEK